MCGILGIISQNKKNLETFANKSSLNSISHRGPDSQGYIKGKDFFFGHTRLSIIGLKEKNAKQPILKKNKILSFNGEIYNFKELSKKVAHLLTPSGVFVAVIMSRKCAWEQLYFLAKHIFLKFLLI